MTLVLLTLLLSLVTSASHAEISVTDFVGRKVTLAEPAQRIIGLAPHIVENTYSAGAGDRLVGVVEYSNYPAAATEVHRIGNYTSWSLEEIVALKPDLILLWASGNGMHKLEMLERLGLKVYVSEPRQLSDIPATIRAIGHLAGTDATSEVEARRLEKIHNSLQQRYSARDPVAVFYQVWNQPLQTLNGEHLVSHVIELCGGNNIYADAALLAPRINLESVLQRNPDAIMASGMGTARPAWLDDWKSYPDINAVRRDGLFFIHPDLIQRPTARVMQGAAIMCEQLAGLRQRM